MSDDPFKEASRYNTAVRNVQKWFEKRLLSITIDKDTKIHELRQALSPAAARIVVAAESDETEETETLPFPRSPSGFAPDPDPNPVPDWLNREPAPMPAGSLLEVEHKPRKRA